MSLVIYNVKKRKKEEFVPIEEGKVRMYACGITASGSAHIGHAYQAIVFDMIRRYLEYIGNEVTYVRNYTDVDDKIIIKAREEQIDPMTFAKRIMEKTDLELKKFGVEPPTIQSKATDCIEDIINFISKLIEKGHAYETEYGDVFFIVDSFKDYGKFSNRNLDEGLSGVRKEVEPGKKDDKDFALWKKANDDEIFWESPWGKGRPGWHIECSAMSMKYLGDQIDIHGGGKDLLFPHHENEIAQSESLTNKTFANYWIHNGLIKVNGQKMGKSLNNSIYLEDLLNTYNSEVLRFTLLQNNYRSDLNVVDGMFETNEKHIYKFYQTLKTLNEKLIGEYTINEEIANKINKEFKEAMDNDFNTSLAISNLIGYEQEINRLLTTKGTDLNELFTYREILTKTYSVLSLLNQDPDKVLDDIKNKYLVKYDITKEEIENIIKERQIKKETKDYEGADELRNNLLERGISLMDTREGTLWDINFK